MTPTGRAASRLALGAAAAVVMALGAGCGQECCTLDSFPIGLQRAPLGAGVGAGQGALLAAATAPSIAGGQPFPMLVDTGTPVTILNESGAGSRGALETQRRAFDLLDASGGLTSAAPIRARFQGVAILDLPLAGVGDATTVPLGLMGGDLLHAFSVDMRFSGPCPGGDGGAGAASCSSFTFWRHQGANLGFLEDAGYAVLRFPLFGGGEVTASGDPDVIGARGPLVVPASRVVLRACVGPSAFDPATAPRELCCTRGAEVSIVTGVDMSLMVATGVGPLVLGQSAWMRLAATLDVAPPALNPPPPLHIATWPTPIATVLWTSIPRFALVDLEAGANNNPGPCIELGRARRIEWVSHQNVVPDGAACFQPCDTDTQQPDLAQNSAAYIEIGGGSVPVAVIADDEPWLQGLRFDIRPEGPEIDGVVGAGALGPSRVELDYLSSPARALFSCEPGAARPTCFAAARCPRLPDHTETHFCFGLGAQSLPPTCAPSGC